MAEPDVLAAVRPVEAELGRALEVRGSRFAAPFITMTGVPAGSRRRRPSPAACQPESAFTGLSMRSASSMKAGIRSWFVAQLLLELGPSSEDPERRREQAGRGLAAGAANR